MTKQLGLLTTTIILGLGLTACEKSTPDWDYMPDMFNSTSFKAQKEDPNSKDGAAARMPVAGTIPRGFVPYHFALMDHEKAGLQLKNPLPPTKSVLERGQKMYMTYCVVCHGPIGDGAGYIVPKFPRPPAVISDKVRNWKDGTIFHVMTVGQNLMPSYAQQIQAIDRWAIVHYVRALQRAAQPTAKDLQDAGVTK